MICEECGIRAATFHITAIIQDGQTREHNLCSVCMAKYQRQLPGLSSDHISTISNLINSLLVNMRARQVEIEDGDVPSDLACDVCGMTYAEFRKTGMLGCANCYKVFREPLDTMLQQIHGNTQHTGKIPGAVRSGVSLRMNIERLKLKLQQAIAQEEYEQAARLRDAIRSLNAKLASAENPDGEIRVEPQARLDQRDQEEGE